MSPNDNPREADNPDILLVLGTHRSGTSLVTHLLSLLGGHLSSALIESKDSNRGGHFEDAEVVEITKSIESRLNRPHFNVLGTFPIDSKELTSTKFTAEKQSLEKILLRNISHGPCPWILKDPRTQRMLPLWNELFREHNISVELVTCLRHPEAAIRSRASRNNISLKISQLLWMTEMAELIVNTGGYPGVIIEFEKLVQDPVSALSGIQHLLPAQLRHDIPALTARLSGIVSGYEVHFSSRETPILWPDTADFYNAILESVQGSTDGQKSGARDRTLRIANSHLDKLNVLSGFIGDNEWLTRRLISTDRQMNRERRKYQDTDKQLRKFRSATVSKLLELEGVTSASGTRPETTAEQQYYEPLNDIAPRHPEAGTVVFPGLTAPPAEVASRPLKVCIVTPDIVGPIRNGGIGTAYRYVADLLTEAGHQVTILYVLGNHCENGKIEDWVTYYRKRGITFIPMPHPVIPPSRGTLSSTTRQSRGAYEWLLEHHFDLVHVSEWRGTGYYALLAKRLGLAFSDTVFCVKCSSPTLWNKLGGMTGFGNLGDACISYMERRSVELADVVVSGSLHLLRWMLEKGYRIQHERTFVQPNIMLTSTLPETGRDDKPVDRRPITELVFFGRLEPRKGLHIFCNAVDQLFRSGNKPEKVTFLGKLAKVFDAEEFIAKHSNNWKCEVSIITDRNQPEAIKYLGDEGRLAVIPSLLENSSFAIYECLIYRIPFIASDCGGNPELIDPESRPDTLFSTKPTDLARLMGEILEHGARTPQPSFDYEKNNRIWLDWHAMLCNPDARAALSSAYPDRFSELAPDQLPLVSVCVAHYERPDMIDAAIDSIRKQTYPNIEVILVDDGSHSQAARLKLRELGPEFKAKGWKIIRKQNEYLGASRNTAAGSARGQYLLFMDDDNIAKPNEVEKFVRTAFNTGVDILTCFSDTIEHEDSSYPPKARSRITPLGADLAFGLFRNGFGDSNCFVSKDAFNAVGGFTEHYRVGRDDHEFFVRIITRGFRLEVLPEALFWYRKNPASASMKSINLSQIAGQIRVVDTYISNTPLCLQNIFMLGLMFYNISEEQKLELRRVRKELKTLRDEKNRTPRKNGMISALLRRIRQKLRGRQQAAGFTFARRTVRTIRRKLSATIK